MSHYTRRDFLRNTTAGGAAALLGRAVAQEASSSAVTPKASGKMAIARYGGEGPVDAASIAAKLAEQAVNNVGGMAQFVSKGDVVWIKPNIGWNRTPEQAANTNPQVVGKIVEMCLKAGAKTVKVGDNACNDPRQTYSRSGIESAVNAAGGEVIYLDKNRFRKMAIGGERLKEWEVYPEIVESDVVINIPVAKHHGLSRATLCMKNYMGIVGGNRGMWHQDLPTCLSDITAFMKPKLTILDAVRVLTAHGPTGGSLEDVEQLNTVAAGTDIVALDAFGATLLGHDLTELGTVKAGVDRGLGTAEYTQLDLKEVTVS